MDADEIRRRIKKHDSYALGALLRLYQCQTVDEQISQRTSHDNQIGFNGIDAEILSSITQFYIKHKRLSDKQIRLIRPKLYKYCGQLARIGGVEPVEMGDSARRTKRRKHKYVEELPNEELKVVFPYDPDLIDVLRNISGRKFVKEGKYWIVPKSAMAVEKLLESSFDIPDALARWWESIQTVKDIDPDSINLNGFKGELYPFQKQGVAFIESRHGKALIADDMGLGKTVQALAWLHRNPEVRPVLIVVPASVKLNWRKEALRFMNNPKVVLLYGQTPEDVTFHKDTLVIINYDILHHWTPVLAKQEFKAMILDEAHRTKNYDTKRTRAAMKLAKKVKRILALTGTPILNRPIEIFNCLRMLRPKVFRSRWEFARQFCDLHHDGFAWNMNGASNKQELHKLLSSEIMIRRKKSEVLTELPDKQRIPVPVEIGNRAEYRQAERDFISYIGAFDWGKAERAQRAKALAEIEGLKQLCLEGKMNNCLSWIDDFLEDSDEKLVIFTVHKVAVDTLMRVYGSQGVKIDGRVPQNKRQAIVEKFQEDPNTRVFVGNIQAAGEGITLAAASNAVFIELPWTPGALEQASDRIHRIGQEADSVNIYYLIAERTIDERILRILDAKRRVLDEVIDGLSPEQQESTLSALLKDYKEGV